MTRLAIIGSSHCGCIREAHGRIKETFPQFDVTFFAMPGAMFSTAYVDANGVFCCRPKDSFETRMINRINGAASIDLTPFDVIWIVGFRFAMIRLLSTLEKFDILEAPRTGSKQLMSNNFFRTAMATEAEQECQRIADMVRHDTRVVISPAPYPAAAVYAPGPYHESYIAHVFAHPGGKSIQAQFTKLVASASASAGLGYVPQPDHTIAGPFATDSLYLHGARDFRDPDKASEDLRHMNSDFGFDYFRAFAELHPG